VLSKATGVEVTPDSLFQIGSITKVWTATLVLQLVDEGRLDLDEPVAEVLPGFRVADAERDPRGDDAPSPHAHERDRRRRVHRHRPRRRLRRALRRGLAEIGQNHPLGATWSYCNAGFVVLGRIVEHVTGLTWDGALRERLARRSGSSTR
jgi:CubicO group peptidase (beta-lactamase class C family)